MLLGALLDAETGLAIDVLRTALAALPIEGYELKLSPFQDHGLTGSRFEVLLTDQEQPMRSFSSIATLIQNSTLPSTVRERAIAIFRTLGEAEATIHGVTLDEIHFHEVGAVDAIVDIVGAALALEALAIEQVYSSPLPLTRGHMRMAHGLMPLPAPATLEILRKAKAPWVPSPIEGELVTPTGAAILATVASFEMPAITIERIGYGFGQKHLIWPNCLRACLGTVYGELEIAHSAHHYMHEHEHEHTHSHHSEHSYPVELPASL